MSGKIVFAAVNDFTGSIQVMLSLAEVGQESLDHWKQFVDLGDQVGVVGEVIASKRGELSVLAHEWVMTSKCLVPLPDKHKGLADAEARVRQRYVDLIVNDSSREMLELRSRVVRSVRESLWRRGFLEVETPMLQPIHGGANARPFTTHINAYDMRLYMRIAPELYLKKLLVGGAPKVFEMNRNFRNEGADATHNPRIHLDGDVRRVRRLRHHARPHPRAHHRGRRGGVRASRHPSPAGPTAASRRWTSPASGR